MAVTAKYYGLFFKSLFNGECNFGSDTIKCALFDSDLVVNQDTHQYFDAAPYTGSDQVPNGSGYTTGGATLTSVAVTYDAGTNVLKFDAENVSWTSATFTARYAVVYDSTPSSNKPLIMYVDFGADQSPSAGTLQITFDTAGLGTVTVA